AWPKTALLMWEIRCVVVRTSTSPAQHRVHAGAQILVSQFSKTEATSADSERLPFSTAAPLSQSSTSPASHRNSKAPLLQQGENQQISQLKSNIWQAIRTKNAEAFVDCFFIEERFNTARNS